MMALLAVKIINLWKSASVVYRVAIVAEANLWRQRYIKSASRTRLTF